MNSINDYILPIISILIIIYGYLKKVNIYESFLNGVTDGFKVIIDIAPTIITMCFVINIFISSKFLHYFISNVKILPPEIFSMLILKPISGSATLGILKNIFDIYGPDSFNGLLASLIQGSTETTVYVIALYFGSVGIKKIKNTLKIGLLVDAFGIILGVIFAYLFFK